MKHSILAASAAAIMALGLATTADATIIGQRVNANLANNDFTVNFGSNNQASYTFGGGNFAFGTSRYNSPDTVKTGGSARISSQGGGFFGKPLQPQAFSTGGVGLSVPDNLFPQFGPSSFDSPTPIPASRGPGFLALQFQLDDGAHFGYAEITTNELISYGYQSQPGASIQAGALPGGAAPVPEPPSWAVLALGLGLTGFWAVIRRRRGGSEVKAP